MCFSLKAQDKNPAPLKVRFTGTNNLEYLKAIARKENKNIFIDCYTTWCAPCRMMDLSVFSNPEVGTYLNSAFICVKVQMDSTASDIIEIQSRYEDARQIKELYAVSAFPTLIFINSEGKLLNKITGFRDAETFLQLAKDCSNPELTYDFQKEAFLKQEIPIRELSKFAISAKQVNDSRTADSAARIYKEKYLDLISDEKELLSNEHTLFIKTFPEIINSKDRYFHLFFTQQAYMDSVFTYPGISKTVVYRTILREEVKSKIQRIDDHKYNVPDWDSLKKTITTKYTKHLADTIIINSMISWYLASKDWPKSIDLYVKKNERYGIQTDGLSGVSLNNIVFNLIFKKCEDVSVLNKAISWMELLISVSPQDYQYLDTYANLLYKVGRQNEAVEVQTKAVEILELTIQEKGMKEYLESDLLELNKVLNLMRKGIPTWPLQTIN